MDEVFQAPQAKMLEPVSKFKGKSQLKDQQKILRARTRNHARDHDLEDLITTNSKEVVKKNKWVNSDGRKRRKIDDL